MSCMRTSTIGFGPSGISTIIEVGTPMSCFETSFTAASKLVAGVDAARNRCQEQNWHHAAARWYPQAGMEFWNCALYSWRVAAQHSGIHTVTGRNCQIGSKVESCDVTFKIVSTDHESSIEQFIGWGIGG
eukprot:604710-Pelagomonas_calceolata.AAC.1